MNEPKWVPNDDPDWIKLITNPKTKIQHLYGMRVIESKDYPTNTKPNRAERRKKK